MPEGGGSSGSSIDWTDGQGNWLLRRLDRPEAQAVAASARAVTLDLRQPMYAVGRPIEQVCFPIDCVVSLVADMPDGRPVEIATVGAEGMVGLPLVLGTEEADTRAFVQVAGRALRMSASDFTSLLSELPGFNRLLHRYAEALFLQVARSAACNQVHPIAERAARWLLMTHDRVGRDEFPLTQEFLAQMLGVRRAGVSEVASALSRAGLIRYQRGQVAVTDRAGLEAASCGCYQIIRDRYQGLLQ
jgi:CRP-like cAMP-binding protein